MPKCKTPICNSNVIKDSPSHFVCSGPGGCGKNFQISCARKFVQTIASQPCCAAIKTYEYNLGQTNSAFDKNRPLLNCSAYLSDKSVANISNTMIQSSSPNSNLDNNFSQLASTLSQPVATSNFSSQSIPLTSISLSLISTSVTSSCSIPVITSTYITTSAFTITTFTNATITTPQVLPSCSTSQNLNLIDAQASASNYQQQMIVESSDVPSNDQHEVQLGARTINQMGPPII